MGAGLCPHPSFPHFDFVLAVGFGVVAITIVVLLVFSISLAVAVIMSRKMKLINISLYDMYDIIIYLSLIVFNFIILLIQQSYIEHIQHIEFNVYARSNNH